MLLLQVSHLALILENEKKILEWIQVFLTSLKSETLLEKFRQDMAGL